MMRMTILLPIWNFGKLHVLDSSRNMASMFGLITTGFTEAIKAIKRYSTNLSLKALSVLYIQNGFIGEDVNITKESMECMKLNTSKDYLRGLNNE